jgi:hypothetical protein
MYLNKELIMPYPRLPAAPKMSRTKALNEKCKQCIYDPEFGGTWREQVENCTTSSCPIWQHRPKTSATIAIVRKNKSVDELDLDALVDSLPTDEAEEQDEAECIDI